MNQQTSDFTHPLGTVHHNYRSLMQRIILITAMAVALAGFATPAKGNLEFAGLLFTDFPFDATARAAALERQFHTGPLTFLGGYTNDPTGALAFVPGAITDPSLLSYELTDPGAGMASWDLTGTGFQTTWVVSPINIDPDFSSDAAFRVTPDESLNSRGPQPLSGLLAVDFFGPATNVSDWGSTVLLLASAGVGLALGRRFWSRKLPACPPERERPLV